VVNTVFCEPRRVLHHLLVRVSAKANEPGWALLTRVLVRVDDVLSLKTRVARLRVVRVCLRLEPRGTASEPKPAGVIDRRRPLPRSRNRFAAVRASLVFSPEGAEAVGTRGPGRAGDAGPSSVIGSRVHDVEALCALARVGARLSVMASGVSTGRAGLTVGKSLGVVVGIVGILRTDAACLRTRRVFVCSWLTIRTRAANFQSTLRASCTRFALLLVPLVCHADLRVASRARLQLVNPTLRRPRRVLHHLLVRVSAKANEPGWALLTRVLVRVDDVLSLKTRVARLRVVRVCLRLEPRGTASEPKPAGVIDRRRPLPRSRNRFAAVRASLVFSPEGAEAVGTRGPGRAGDAGPSSVIGSRVHDVEALCALARVGARLSVMASGVSTGRAGLTVAQLCRALLHTICADWAPRTRLRAHCLLVEARRTRRARHARLCGALFAFAANLTHLLVVRKERVICRARVDDLVADWTACQYIHAAHDAPVALDKRHHITASRAIPASWTI